MIPVAACVIGYLIGGIPTGLLVCRLVKGVDPRSYGSGSSGATNVSRVLGKKWAVFVLLLDALKGYLPVTFLPGLLTGGSASEILQVLTAAGLVVGHIWTPYARFKGGKGVATAAGAMIAIDIMVVRFALVVWLVVFLPFRIVSIASLAAAVSLPVYVFLIGNRSMAVSLFSCGLALLILFTHRENIRRLFRRDEKSIV